MYRLFLLLIFVKTVNSHGGHGDSIQTKESIQDALLSYLCHGANGFPCNGHGSCSSGACTCFHGYSGSKCEINDADITSVIDTVDTSFGSSDVGGLNLHDLISPLGGATDPPQTLACLTSDENTCSGHGLCHEGSCICEPGYSGIICELSHDQGFCKTYKECAECTAFMNDCPKKCSLIAKFRLVFGFPRERDGGSFRKCRFRNSDFNCTFYFKQESETQQGMKTIAVKACLNYNEATTKANETVEQLKDKPLQPVTPSPTQARTTTTVGDIGGVDHSHESLDTHTHGDHTHDNMVDTGTHSHGDHTHDSTGDDGKQDKSTGDSGASFSKPTLLAFIGIGSIILLL